MMQRLALIFLLIAMLLVPVVASADGPFDIRRTRFKPSAVNGYARSPGESVKPEYWRGLVRLWAPIVGQTGSTLREYSPRKASFGTITNAQFSPGKNLNGYILEFDGTGDFAQIANYNFGLNPFTIVAVVRFDEVTVYDVAVGKDVSTDRDYALGVGAFGSGVVNFTALPPDGFDLLSTATVSNGEWIVVVVTRNGTTHNLYLNGLQESTGGTAKDYNGANDIFLGRREFVGFEQELDGGIAMVAFYDYPMTADQVLDLSRDPFALLRLREDDPVFPEQAAAAAGPTPQIIIIGWELPEWLAKVYLWAL